MVDNIIEVRDFSKRYGTFVAVDELSFDVREGDIFALLGPNGAGKTSTLEAMEGIRKCDGGSLKIAGFDPVSQSNKLRDVIGVQLQSGGLPEHITPAEAMAFFCAYHMVDVRTDLLDRMGLNEKKGAQFIDLSAGQQRRLALALAIAHNPKILFLDEPTAGLDVASRRELHSLMQELKENGTTIILATHDMAEAEKMSDRVAILLRGKLATIGTPMEITATGAGLTKISVRSRDSKLIKTDAELPGVSKKNVHEEYAVYFSKEIGATIGVILRKIEDEGDELIDLRVERPSLEDRFLEITNEGGMK
ncbi:MAG: ABC transporter ATP-binding protein [Anaerolineae bacterium]|nr:ABC transporter ATP-binding protein [Anaerolineae bacterium]